MNALRFRPWVVGMLCLGLVLPGVGQAAQGEPTPGTQQDAPRSLLAAEPEGRQTGPAIPRGLRILGEVGGGVVSASVMGVVGSLAGGFFCNLISPPPKGSFANYNCVIPGALGFGLGVMGGAALGVWSMGDLLGGDGSFLSALGGGVLGVLSASVLSLTLAGAPLSPGRSIALGVGLPVLGLAGFVLGYELSQKMPRGGVQPLLAFTPGGAVMGLGGHF